MGKVGMGTQTRRKAGIVKRFRRWSLWHFKPNEDPLPCPACDRIDMVWAGVEACMSAGVGCRRCRLKVIRDFPEKTPKSMPKNLGRVRRDDERDEWSDWLYCYCTAEALEVWNSLPRRPVPMPVKKKVARAKS